MNEKLGVVDQQLLKTANRKQQNTDNGLWMTEKLDIMFEILHELGSLGPIRDTKTMMSHWFGSEFSFVFVIITTIINSIPKLGF